jgi:hypothetical protein
MNSILPNAPCRPRNEDAAGRYYTCDIYDGSDDDDRRPEPKRGAHGGVSNVAVADFLWLLDLPLVIVGIDGAPTMLTRRSCRIH